MAFKIENSQEKRLRFKVITIVDDINYRQHINRDELKEILGTLGLAQNEVYNYRIEGEIVHIKDGKLNIGELGS